MTDYPDGGVAEVAETLLGGDRLVVRCTRLVGAQATLWPDWRYHAFITDARAVPWRWTPITVAMRWWRT